MRRNLLYLSGLLLIVLFTVPFATASAQSGSPLNPQPRVVTSLTASSDAAAPATGPVGGVPIADVIPAGPLSCADATAIASKLYAKVFVMWANAAARGKELGLSDAQLAKGEQLVLSNITSNDRQMKLVDLFRTAGTVPDPDDLITIYAVVDARTAWDKAVVTMDVACGKKAPASPASANQVQVKPHTAPNTGGGPLN